jgi:hypothetical protein
VSPAARTDRAAGPYGERTAGAIRHRCVFRLLAPEAPLDLSPGASLDTAHAELYNRWLTTGTLTGLFVR